MKRVKWQHKIEWIVKVTKCTEEQAHQELLAECGDTHAAIFNLKNLLL